MPYLSRQRNQVTHITRNQFPAHRIAQGLLQDLMVIAYTAWLPSLGELLGLQLLDILRGELLQLDKAESGQDVMG